MNESRDETARSRARGETEDVLRDQVRAWWVSVLAGQVDQSHPTYGDVSAKVEGDTMVLRGQVPTVADRAEVEHEVEHLLGQGVEAVRNELTVKPEAEVEEERGLLSQTFIAAYDAPAGAKFAAGYLREHLHGRTAAISVITPDDGEGEIAGLVPADYLEDARALLKDGRSLVVVTVDETEAFAARELLDEDTRSLQTIVLPPQAGNAAEEAGDVERVSGGRPESGPPGRR